MVYPMVADSDNIKETTSVGTDQGKRYLLLSVLLVALLVRLLYVFLLDQTEIWTPWSTLRDAYSYNENAVSIIDYGVFGYRGRPSAFHPPLYGFFLAFVYMVFGMENYFAVRIIQVLLSVCTILTIYHIAKNIFNEDVGTIAAVISSFYPLSLYFCGEIVTETLFIFLLNLSVLFLISLRTQGSVYRCFLSGMLFSLTFLCRAIIAFVPLAVLSVAFASNGTRRVFNSGSFLSGLASLIAVWTVRNYLVFHSFMPLPVTGGYTLALGATTLPYTEAMATVKERIGYNHWDIKDPRLKGKIDEARVDRQSKALARELILQNPLGYVKYISRNFQSFFLDFDFSAIETRSLAGLVSVITSILYVVIGLMAITALPLAFRQRIIWGPLFLLGLVISSALFHSLFLVGTRYRFATADYYLIILAAYSMVRLLENRPDFRRWNCLNGIAGRGY